MEVLKARIAEFGRNEGNVTLDFPPDPSAGAGNAILRTMSGLVDERGYRALTVDEIAGAADVARSTFYTYFPSKLAGARNPSGPGNGARRPRTAPRPPHRRVGEPRARDSTRHAAGKGSLDQSVCRAANLFRTLLRKPRTPRTRSLTTHRLVRGLPPSLTRRNRVHPTAGR